MRDAHPGARAEGMQAGDQSLRSWTQQGSGSGALLPGGEELT